MYDGQQESPASAGLVYSNTLIKTQNVSITSVGLTVTGDMEFSEWMDLMQSLVRLETAFQFAIGDALIWGESRYGEKYSQAMEATGLSYQALANMVWVARKVPMQNRMDGLSWTHHRVVASVEPVDQLPFLEYASASGLSATGLQHHITGREPRQSTLVAIPAGVTHEQAVAVLSELADAVRLSRSGEPDPNHGPESATLSCVLCNKCPYKTSVV